ncbi:MAG: c-type cytochrome [Bacteroidota bacterium]|jgi:hypothetical protein
MPRGCLLFLLGMVLVLFSACKQNRKEVFFGETGKIIYKKCSGCHYQGGPAPFSLYHYDEIRRRATSILAVLRTGYMPPWPADTGYSRFRDEKILSLDERQTIEKWIRDGCEKGDSLKDWKRPSFFAGSTMGRIPDKVVYMQKAFPIEADNTDRFVLMKLPFELEKDTVASCIEFVPDKIQVVHHVNAQLLRYEEHKKKQLFDGKFFVDTRKYPQVLESYEAMHLAHDDGTYPIMHMSACNYLPGFLPIEYPPGIGGIRLAKKSALFLKDIHYGPSNKTLKDSSHFNIYFSKVPIKRQTYEMQMGTLGISKIEPPLVIPPNEVKTFQTRLTLTGDISLLTINPHMHLLGKSFWAFAITPNGDTIPLIRIKQWDFKWQYSYTYRNPLHLPAGTTIRVFGTFDNTINNPLNPFHPPRTVSEREGSMRTTDEMFQFIFTYMPYQTGDENIDLE